MTRIFIEDFELDVDAGLSNRITYAIDDLQNLDSKATPFTKTIILPGTAISYWAIFSSLITATLLLMQAQMWGIISMPQSRLSVE
jgi:hypothetical protein